jgi:signal transduction histidine kinase/CheY-like chemotaxis protein
MSDSKKESGLAHTDDSAAPLRLAERVTAAQPSADWPPALQHAVRLCLNSAAPAAVLCGEDLCIFYNEALRSLLGAGHLGAVGMPLSVCSPQLARALSAHLARAARGEPQALCGVALAGVPGRDGHLQIDAYLTPVTEERSRVSGIALQAYGKNELPPGNAETAMQEELRCTQLLCKVGAKLAHEQELATLYRDILDTAIALTHADAGTVQILNPERDALEILATKGFSPSVTEHFRWVSAKSATSCGGALRAGARTYVDFDDPGLADLLEMRLHTGDGYYSAQSTPLVTRAGQPIGMVSTHWRQRRHRPNERELRYLDLLARQTADLLERRQTEIALKEADRRKDIFLATLAHELRNPLAPIRTGLEMLRTAPANACPDGVHRMIERQVSHMVRLIDDLLELSRISSGKIRLRREVVALEQLVDGALEGNRRELEAGHFALTLDLPPNVYLDVDPTRFVQVLSNLLQNASKFTPAEGRIAINGMLSREELVLSVQDSGRGIGAAMLPKVFEPFMQEHPGAEQAGLGLGLALARQLIELHGGSLEASSAGENRGSCFSIRIPALSGHAAAPQPLAPETEALAHGRILVIDDNVDAANSMAMLLQHYGASTAVAHDGPNGLRLAEQFQPQAVLLDIGMPGMNGFETCQQLRRLLGQSVRIVALTGWGQQRDREATALAGCDEHLIKPATVADLQRALRAKVRP